MVYAQSPLESDAQLSQPSKRGMGSLHNLAVPAHLFAAFYASPFNAAEDATLVYVGYAAWITANTTSSPSPNGQYP